MLNLISFFQEVTPIAKRLGEKVFANCAEKLKPYLTQAVESLHISLDEYNKIVTSVCEGTLPAVDHINDSVPKEQLVSQLLFLNYSVPELLLLNYCCID